MLTEANSCKSMKRYLGQNYELIKLFKMVNDKKKGNLNKKKNKM